MGSTGDGQKAEESAWHARGVLILRRLEILEANSAAWEFFKLSLAYQLSILLHVALYVFGEWGALFSPLLPSTAVADTK